MNINSDLFRINYKINRILLADFAFVACFDILWKNISNKV